MKCSKEIPKVSLIMAAVAMVIQTFFLFVSVPKVYADDTEMNLGPYVTSADLTYTNQEGEECCPKVVDGTCDIPDGCNTTLKIYYHIPEKTLSEDKHTLTMQVPDGLKIESDQSGEIMDGDSEEGTYNISTDGTVTLDFNQSAIDECQNGPLSDGVLSIQGKIDLTKRTNDGNIPLDINGDASPEITIHVTPSLEVTKSATQSPDSKIAHYTITVYAPIGSNNKDVTVEDTVAPDEYGSINLDDPENISVVTSTGEVIPESEIKVEKEDGKTRLVLPPLGDNESYTITYDAKIRVTNGKQISATNTAVASTPEIQTAPSSASVAYTPLDLVKKDGKEDQDGMITWTITVNPEKADISGWKLSDVWSQPLLPNNEVTGTASIDPPVDGESVITLPFTFPPGSDQTYTITYTQQDGNNVTTNTATLTPPNNGPSAQATKTVGSNIGTEDVNKEFVSAEKDGKLTLLNWKIQLEVTNGDMFMFTETLSDGQYFTKAQLLAFQENLEKALANDDLSIPSKDIVFVVTALEPGLSTGMISDLNTGLSADGKYTAFDLIVLSTIPNGTVLDLNCQSTAELDPDQKADLSNSIESNGKTATAYYHYQPTYPTISKFDLNDENYRHHTTHNYDGEGPAWGVALTYDPEAGYPKQPVVVSGKIPKGLTSKDVHVYIRPTESGSDWSELSKEEIDQYFKIDVDRSSSPETMNVTIDPALYKQYPDLEGILLTIRTDYDKDLKWEYTNGKSVKEFENTASASVGDHDCGSATQKQTITRFLPDYSGLSKSISEKKQDGGFPNNLIPYTIDVNPKAKKLLEGDALLTVEDVLDVTSSDTTPVNPELVNGSVAVYEVEGEKKAQLSTLEYTVTLKRVPTGNGSTKTTIVFKVPDGMHLEIDYQVLFSGKVGVHANVNNTASMSGTSEGRSDSGVPTALSIERAIATIEDGGISIRKSDADNYDLTLPGAEFEISKYNPDTGDFDPITGKDDQPETFTTGNDGTLFVPRSKLSYDTAYQIQEISAPYGYKKDDTPIDFILTEGDFKPETFRGPEGFLKHAYIYNVYGQVSVSNKKIETSIHVKKVWEDSKGDPVDAPVDKIEVGLYQTIDGKESPRPYRSGFLYSDADWALDFNHLPEYDGDADTGKKITYSIKELTTSDKWTAEITMSDEKNVLITNTLKGEKIVLPVTGSFSVWLWPAAGTSLILAGALAKKRRSFSDKKNDPKK